MRRLRLRNLAGFVPVASLLCAALVLGEDFPSRGIRAESPLGHSPYPSSLVDEGAGQQDEVIDAAPFDDPWRAQPGNESPDQEHPYWGLHPSDVFPLSSCDESLRDWPRDCDPSPAWGVALLVGYDAWRGVSDDSWENNGIHAGANFGTNLGEISDWTGIGMQVGGTVGAYNWAGNDYRPTTNAIQVQGFITYGFFRKATELTPWSAALVQDWMLNDNFGVFARDPTLSQLRAQVGYATSACNELGLWGTCRVVGDTQFVNGVGPTTWRPQPDQLVLAPQVEPGRGGHVAVDRNAGADAPGRWGQPR